MPGWNKWRNLYDCLHVEFLGFVKDVTAELMRSEALDAVADGSAADLSESLWVQWLDYLCYTKATKQMGKESCFTPLTIGVHAWHSYPTLAQRIKGAECLPSTIPHAAPRALSKGRFELGPAQLNFHTRQTICMCLFVTHTATQIQLMPFLLQTQCVGAVANQEFGPILLEHISVSNEHA